MEHPADTEPTKHPLWSLLSYKELGEEAQEYEVIDMPFKGSIGRLADYYYKDGEPAYYLAFKTSSGVTRYVTYKGLQLRWIDPAIKIEKAKLKKNIEGFLDYARKKSYYLLYDYQGETDGVYDLEETIKAYIETI